jgi:hypothetical protein
MAMRRMRVIGAMRVHGTFAVRCLASCKVSRASPAGGVPRRNKKKVPVSGGPSHIENENDKIRRTPQGPAGGKHVRTRPAPR